MPTFVVTSPEGTVTQHSTYNDARLAKARTGGRISVVKCTP
jgi:hypothetical protein